jgi:hypothetical protein
MKRGRGRIASGTTRAFSVPFKAKEAEVGEGMRGMKGSVGIQAEHYSAHNISMPCTPTRCDAPRHRTPLRCSATLQKPTIGLKNPRL